MKRIIILIDGTWDEEGVGNNTNVAILSGDNKRPLIKTCDSNGVKQLVVYHKGVGTEKDLLKHILGGAIGLGLKQIVLDAYASLTRLYESGDDIFALGFSRGAYAARALVGMIGASGIVRDPTPAKAQAAWNHYRVPPSVRAAPQAAGGSNARAIRNMEALRQAGDIHSDNRVKCVAVWDTVGSYGVPAGIGLAPLARYIALASLGFHDTHLGDHVEFGFHAVAIDEHRRAFVPTFWTAPKDQPSKSVVEQSWFAGAHSNVGGGEADPGLSTEALVWMIARMEALTGLAFDTDAVKASALKANIDGEVYDSTLGWPIDHHWPHLRTMLPPQAVKHGFFTSRADPTEERVNERVHWSSMKKRGRPCTIFGVEKTPYDPLNMSQNMPPEKIAAITPEEQSLLGAE